MPSPSTRPSNKALLRLGRVRVLNHYHFDLFFAFYLNLSRNYDFYGRDDFFFFALHLILSSYFDVVDTRTRSSNDVNTCYSASLSNFP